MMLFTIFEWLFESGALKYIAGVTLVVLLLRWCNKPEEVPRLHEQVLNKLILNAMKDDSLSVSEAKARINDNTLKSIESWIQIQTIRRTDAIKLGEDGTIEPR